MSVNSKGSFLTERKCMENSKRLSFTKRWDVVRQIIEYLTIIENNMAFAKSDPLYSKILQKYDEFIESYQTIHQEYYGRAFKSTDVFNIGPLAKHTKTYFYSITKSQKQKAAASIIDFCRLRKIDSAKYIAQLDLAFNTSDQNKIQRIKNDFETFTYKTLDRIGSSHNSRNSNKKYQKQLHERAIISANSYGPTLINCLEKILRLNKKQTIIVLNALNKANFNIKKCTTSVDDVIPLYANIVVDYFHKLLATLHADVINEFVTEDEAKKLVRKYGPRLISFVSETCKVDRDLLKIEANKKMMSFILSEPSIKAAKRISE